MCSLQEQLVSACLQGDLDVVSQCRDAKGVNWLRLMNYAYCGKHMDIVRYIQMSQKVDLTEQLKSACCYGDKYLVEKKLDDESANFVIWENIMDIAYLKQQTEIVSLIWESEKVTFIERLNWTWKYEDVGFLSDALSKNMDMGHNIDWQRWLEKAYGKRCIQLVRIIQRNNRLFIYNQLHAACEFGDEDFVIECISKNSYSDQKHKWKELLKIAYSKSNIDNEDNFKRIVRCIQDYKEVDFNDQLILACEYDDEEFVSQVLSEHKDNGYETNWKIILRNSYAKCHIRIVRCIQRGNRVDFEDVLVIACEYGDEEFVFKCLVEKKETMKQELWIVLLETAYEKNQRGIVKYIQETGMVKILDLFKSACDNEDQEFLTNYANTSLGKVKSDFWIIILNSAYKRKDSNIVKYIQANGNLSHQAKLECACQHGDIIFISKSLTEKGMTQEIDCLKLIKITYESDNKDIVNYIRESRHFEPQMFLEVASKHGDYESVCQIISNRGIQGIDFTRLVDIANENHSHSIVEYIKANWGVNLNNQHKEKVKYDKSMAVRQSKIKVLHKKQMNPQKTITNVRLLKRACSNGNIKFVEKHLPISVENPHYDIWKDLMNIADDHGKENIKLKIKSALDKVFEEACIVCNTRFVSQYMSDFKEMLHDWYFYCWLAFHYKNTQIAVRIIKSQQITLSHILSDIKVDRYDELVCLVVHHAKKVNARVHKNFTILHVACYYAKLKVIRKLMTKRHIDLDVKGYKNQTPLHILCQGQTQEMDEIISNNEVHEYEEILQYTDKLAKRHNNTDKQENHMSKGCNRHGAIMCLLKKSVNVNAVDFYQQTPLHLACIANEVRCAQLLIESGAELDQVDYNKMNALAFASVHGHFDIVKSLLTSNKCNVNLPNIHGQSSLHLASRENHLTIVKLLIDFDAAINHQDSDGVTPASIASWYGHMDVLSFLLVCKADINIVDSESQSPLHKAIVAGHNNIARMLLKHGAKSDIQDIKGCSPLHLACHSNTSAVKMLLENNGDVVNISNNLGNTALHIGVLSEHMPSIIVLLKYNANVHCRNNLGETALLLAVEKDNKDIVRLLLDRGADIQDTDNIGRGLIHKITLNQMKRMVQYDRDYSLPNVALMDEDLISKLDINAKDFNEQTALHLAVVRGSSRTVHFLMERGADFKVRDKYNHLPIMLSVEYPRLFDYLWNMSEMYLTEEDLQQLTRLAHWFCATEILDKYDKLSRLATNLHHFPQCTVDLIHSISTEQILNNDIPCLDLKSHTYQEHEDMVNIIRNFVEDIQDGVEAIEPLLTFSVQLAGSVVEKTKVLATDEFDVLCILKIITFDKFKNPDTPADPVLNAFVELVCKDEHVKQLKKVLNYDRKLSLDKLYHLFSNAVSKVLARRSLWKKYPNLQRITVNDITAGSRTITALKLRWHDNVYKMLEVSVDLVPVIATEGWKPPWSREHPILKDLDCIIVPKWKSCAPLKFTLLEVGISTWAPVFEQMPEEMRQGYRLAKVVRDRAVCPHIKDWSEVHASDFFSSYMLKQCIITFFCNGNENLEDCSERQWATKIYDMVEDALRNKRLESYFIPGYNLLYSDIYEQYKDQALAFAQLCKKLLTSQNVAMFKKSFMGFYKA